MARRRRLQSVAFGLSHATKSVACGVGVIGVLAKDPAAAFLHVFYAKTRAITDRQPVSAMTFSGSSSQNSLFYKADRSASFSFLISKSSELSVNNLLARHPLMQSKLTLQSATYSN